MRGEITVLVNDVVQWRFHPHRLDEDAVITLRLAQYPPVPIGAELRRDGEFLGTVSCVRKEPFSRWALVYSRGAEEQGAGGQGVTPSADTNISGEMVISQEIITQPTEVTISREIIEAQDGESISREIIETPTEIPGTPIAVLAAHVDPRLFGTLEQLAETVEELSVKTDKALRAIDGIGPKRLEEIRAACDAVLTPTEEAGG